MTTTPDLPCPHGRTGDPKLGTPRFKTSGDALAAAQRHVDAMQEG